MNWYWLYKFAFRNPSDLLAMNISSKIFGLIKASDGLDISRTINIDKNCDLFLHIIHTEDDKLLRYNTFDIVANMSHCKDRSQNPSIRVELYLDNQFSEFDFEQLNYVVFDAIRHELEHYRQYRDNNSFIDNEQLIEGDDLITRYYSLRDYLLSEVEIEPYIRGLVLSAKKQKRPFSFVLEENLNGLFFNNDSRTKAQVMQSDIGAQTQLVVLEVKTQITDRASQLFPKLRLS